MNQINIEIKARCSDPERIRAILEKEGADYKGLDHQTDIYFKVPKGRLKLRKGDIENCLIFYSRDNQKSPKQSDVILTKTKPEPAIEKILTIALSVLVKIIKKRHIYFIENVKFHIDLVEGLGSFVEIEAIDRQANIGKQKLFEQCRHYMDLLGIKENDLVQNSYSDMLLAKQ